MDCSYMNQKCPCGRCPQMMMPSAPSMDCGCGEPPVMIPNRPVIEPRMSERPIQPYDYNMGGKVMGDYAMMMGDCPAMVPAHKRCDCPDTGVGGMEQYPTAMGYIPWQQWKQTYPMDKGLSRGTIFPELDLPFVMGRCR